MGGAMLLQLLVLWLKRPGGELPSLFIGGWWGVVEEQGVERPEDGRDRSLLTGMRLDFVPTPPPPPSPHSLILLLLLLTQYNIHSLNCREQPARACWSSRSLVMFARRGSSRYWRLHWRLDAARAPWSRHSMLPEKPGAGQLQACPLAAASQQASWLLSIHGSIVRMPPIELSTDSLVWTAKTDQPPP